jgi:NitT/TauT family transport system substrate-binding protein
MKVSSGGVMKLQINAFFNKNRSPIMMIAAVFALAICGCFSACTRTDNKPAGPPEKVTIAFSATTDAVLAEVALVKGFFLQEGLEVTPHRFPYGKPALEDLMAGNADFATVAETPVMFEIMKGAKIAVIATIQSSKVGNAILARRDKGILTLEDLKGKKIAATMGTTSDYFLDAILGVNGIYRKDVEIVNLKAVEMPDALARGDIDAVSAFTPYVAFTQKKLGDSVITFQNKNIYRWTFNVVAKQEFIRNDPDKVKKMLRALVKAEEFVRGNPGEAQKIVSDFSGIEISIVRDVWANTGFAATLDQSLILALEDESSWAIKHGLTNARTIPNYLDFIYFDGLRSIKPQAVRILR